MSYTSVINVRTESTVKEKAQEIAEKLGFSLSSVINAYLHHFVRTKSVSFSLSEEPTKFLLDSLKESKEDIKNGFVSPAFEDIDEALKWLNDPNKKYVNQI